MTTSSKIKTNKLLIPPAMAAESEDKNNIIKKFSTFVYVKDGQKTSELDSKLQNEIKILLEKGNYTTAQYFAFFLFAELKKNSNYWRMLEFYMRNLCYESTKTFINKEIIPYRNFLFPYYSHIITESDLSLETLGNYADAKLSEVKIPLISALEKTFNDYLSSARGQNFEAYVYGKVRKILKQEIYKGDIEFLRQYTKWRLLARLENPNSTRKLNQGLMLLGYKSENFHRFRVAKLAYCEVNPTYEDSNGRIKWREPNSSEWEDIRDFYNQQLDASITVDDMKKIIAICVKALRVHKSIGPVSSLQQPLSQQQGEEYRTKEDIIPDEENESPDTQLVVGDLATQLIKFFNSLNHENKVIFVGVYVCKYLGINVSFETIGKLINRDKTTVSRRNTDQINPRVKELCQDYTYTLPEICTAFSILAINTDVKTILRSF